MSDYQFKCHHCEQPLEVPADMLGDTICCPSCNGSIELPSPQQDAPETVNEKSSEKDCSTEETGPLAPRSQTIDFKCRHCGGSVTASHTNAGRMTRCSLCGKRIVIPVDAATRPQSSYMNQPRQSQGLGRRGYWIGSGICSVFVTLISFGGPALAIFGLGAGLLGQTVIVAHRLKNIGWNGWLALLIIIPFVNLFVAIPCLAFPSGYAKTKKLDSKGKILIIIIVGMFVLFLIGVWGELFS